MRAVFTGALLAVIVGISQSIDPDSVPLSLRTTWCNNQEAACPLICTQVNNGSEATEDNSCEPDTLDFSCVCGNGISPNASQYTETIPFYECSEANTQCQTACGHDNSCAAACITNNPCGAQDPPRVNTSTITTMPATATDGQAAATSGSAVYTGFGGGPAATTAHNAAPAALPPMALEIGQAYGLGFVLTGLLAGFGLLL